MVVALIEGIDAQIDVGMEPLQGSELRGQPESRNTGSTAQGHGLILSVREQLIGNRIESVQRFVYRLQISLTGTGQR